MRILVESSTYHCLNAGDLAMMMVARERILCAHPDADIRMITTAPELLASFCPGVTPVPGALKQAWLAGSSLLGENSQRLPSSVSRRLKDWEYRFWTRFPDLSAQGVRLKWRLRGLVRMDPSRFLAEIKSSDLVIASGAGILNDAFLGSALALCEVFAAAVRYGVPVFLFGQGIGPITDPQLLSKAREILPRLQFIGLREGRFGPPLLASLGVPPSSVEVTGGDSIELAFCKRPQALGGGIGVNIRVAPYSAVDPEIVRRFRTVVEKAMKKLRAPLLPVPISFHPDESDVRQLRSVFGTSCLPWTGKTTLADPLRVIEQIGKCRIVVTGSYHAAVFALAQGIPAVCVENSAYYSQKFSGLQAYFDAGCTVLAVSGPDFDRRLEDAIDQAWAGAPSLRAPLLEAAASMVETNRTSYARVFAGLKG